MFSSNVEIDGFVVFFGEILFATGYLIGKDFPVMNKDHCVLALVLGLALASLTPSRPARATLGESVDSVANDGRALAAARRAAIPRTGYTVEQVVADAYTVREYVSPSGVVFAIAWNGLAHPDLSLLLGSYAGEYKQVMRQAPRIQGRRHSRVKTDRIIVEKWGHMRNLQGRAYIPALIPPGVGIDEIK